MIETRTSKRTLDAVGVEQILAFLVRRQTTLGTAEALARQPPQQSLALDAERRRRRRQNDKVMRSRTRDRINERLQGLLVDMLLLHTPPTSHDSPSSDPVCTIQPVDKPVEQPFEQLAASCNQSFNRLSYRLFNV